MTHRFSWLVLTLTIAIQVRAQSELPMGAGPVAQPRVLPVPGSYVALADKAPIRGGTAASTLPALYRVEEVRAAGESIGERSYLVRGSATGWVRGSDIIDNDDAIDAVTKAIALAPDSAMWLQCRGYLWFEKGASYQRLGEPDLAEAEYNQALADFQKALKLDSQNAKTLLGRGRARLGLNQLFAATVDLSDCAERAEKDKDRALQAECLTWRGVAYQKLAVEWKDLSMIDKALDDFNAVLRLEPRSESVRNERLAAIAERRRLHTLYSRSRALPALPNQAMGGAGMQHGGSGDH